MPSGSSLQFSWQNKIGDFINLKANLLVSIICPKEAAKKCYFLFGSTISLPLKNKNKIFYFRQLIVIYGHITLKFVGKCFYWFVTIIAQGYFSPKM